MTIHLVYPHHPDRIAAPWSIGNNLAAGLRERGHSVKQYDWEDDGTITPDEGDILLGHPHPAEGHIFCNSLPGNWAKTVAMSPININDFALSVIAHCDHFLAIGGPRWAHLPAEAGIADKTTLVDLAVDAKEFPVRKLRFNPPGARKFLYMGCIVPVKNPEFLAALAEKTDYEWHHIGFGDIPGFKNHGYAAIEHEAIQDSIGHCDFLVMASTFDANPTTVLECGLIGLVSVCSPFCGWETDVTGIFPLDLDEAAGCMESLQYADESELLRRADDVRSTIERDYTWGRFVETVCRAVL